MANVLYAKFKQSLLSQTPPVDLDSDAIKVALVRGYAVDADAHQYLSDVTGPGGGTIVATSPALSGKTVAAGVFDAADATLAAVPAGAACAHLVVFKDTGSAASSPLVAAIDDADGLPYTPDGRDVVVAWAAGVDRIFRI